MISGSKWFYFVLIGCIVTRHFNSNKFSCFVVTFQTATSSYSSTSETIIYLEPKIVRIIFCKILFTWSLYVASCGFSSCSYSLSYIKPGIKLSEKELNKIIFQPHFVLGLLLLFRRFQPECFY